MRFFFFFWLCRPEDKKTWYLEHSFASYRAISFKKGCCVCNPSSFCVVSMLFSLLRGHWECIYVVTFNAWKSPQSISPGHISSCSFSVVSVVIIGSFPCLCVFPLGINITFWDMGMGGGEVCLGSCFNRWHKIRKWAGLWLILLSYWSALPIHPESPFPTDDKYIL